MRTLFALFLLCTVTLQGAVNTNVGGLSFDRSTREVGAVGLLSRSPGLVSTNLGTGTNFVFDIGKYSHIVVQPTAAAWRFVLTNTSTNLNLAGDADMTFRISVTNGTGSTSYATNETTTIKAMNSWWYSPTNTSEITIWTNSLGWHASGTGSPTASGYTLVGSTGTQIDVNTTTSETSIYTNTVPASALGANGKAILILAGDALNNGAAGTYTWRIRIYWNGAVVYDDTSPAIGLSANRFPWRINLRVANLNSASSQAISATINGGAPNTAPPTGAGDWGVTTARFSGIARGTASVDTSAAVPIGITITPSDSHANFSFRRDEAELMTLFQN